MDPLKEKSKNEVEVVVKKKKIVREIKEGPALERMKEVVVEKTPEVGLKAAVKGMESRVIGPKKPVEGGATDPEEGAEQQPKGVLRPKEKERGPG